MGDFEIIDSGAGLTVPLADGTRVAVHALWLREQVSDTASVDSVSGQRRKTSLDFPPELRIVSVDTAHPTKLRIVFSDVVQALWIERNALTQAATHCEERVQCLMPPMSVPFDACVDLDAVSFQFATLALSHEVQLHWLRVMRQYGFARLLGVPCVAGAVEEVVKLFGYVRETNYGRTFQVQIESSPINLAYTAEGLTVHTDNPYRDPAPTLQLLHCLSNDVAGGESTVVDGFAAAQALAQRYPSEFQALCQVAICFRFKSRDTHLEATRPMIALDCESHLFAISFNNRAMHRVNVDYAQAERWYSGYRFFAEMLKAPERAVEFRFAPGDLLMLDNRRVLHGRKAYDGSGTRHLEGCYADIDSLMSRLRVLEGI